VVERREGEREGAVEEREVSESESEGSWLSVDGVVSLKGPLIRRLRAMSDDFAAATCQFKVGGEGYHGGCAVQGCCQWQDAQIEYGLSRVQRAGPRPIIDRHPPSVAGRSQVTTKFAIIFI
jgi:hypothetical protein